MYWKGTKGERKYVLGCIWLGTNSTKNPFFEGYYLF